MTKPYIKCNCKFRSIETCRQEYQAHESETLKYSKYAGACLTRYTLYLLLHSFYSAYASEPNRRDCSTFLFTDFRASRAASSLFSSSPLIAIGTDTIRR